MIVLNCDVFFFFDYQRVSLQLGEQVESNYIRMKSLRKMVILLLGFSILYFFILRVGMCVYRWMDG